MQYLTDIFTKKARSHAETGILAVMVMAFLVLNLATSSRFPLPWQDEDVFADVAINLATGQGFISTVNMCGDAAVDHFWSCNAPMFPFLLSLWIKLFGFTITAVRSLNYVLMILSIVALWYAVRRNALIRDPRQRLLFAGLLMAGYGMGFIYRSARYDCLGILIFSLALLSFSIKSARSRLCAIGCLGALLPLAGIQLILYSAILCLLLLAFLRMRVFWEFSALGAGALLGLCALLALFYWHGVLPNFFSALFGERNDRFRYFVKDPSYVLLLAVCVFLAIDQWRRHEFLFISAMSVGLACGVFIPIFMVIIGKFPIYYSWMAYIPMTMGVTASLSEPRFLYSRRRLTITSCGLALVCLVGLPVQIASALYYWTNRDCGQIEALYARTLNHDDWVYTQYSGYFAARRITNHVFMPFVIPEKYRPRISVMIVSPEDYEQFAHAIIGGDWEDTGDGIVDTGRDLFPNNTSAILLQRRVNLRVYRRATSMTEHAPVATTSLLPNLPY